MGGRSGRDGRSVAFVYGERVDACLRLGGEVPQRPYALDYAVGNPIQVLHGVLDILAYVVADVLVGELQGALQCSQQRPAVGAGLEARGYRMAVAGMTLPNEASVGLHRAMGFEPVGVYRRIGWKFGAWHDVAWTQRALGVEQAAGPAKQRLAPPSAR